MREAARQNVAMPENPMTDPSDPAAWDERYAEAVWSGNPNMALVHEVAAMTPGTALDVGCGEGADAIWLAEKGWQVTGLDVSAVGIDRGRAAAADAGVEIEWLVTGLLGLDENRRFDLVSAFYPVLLRSDDRNAERALLRAVAPGGTLLFVHHVMDAPTAEPSEGGEEAGHGHGHGHEGGHGHGHSHGHGHGHEHEGEAGEEAATRPAFDHSLLVMPEGLHGLLSTPEYADTWRVEVFEERPRSVAAGHAANHHVDDRILRARRLG